MPVHEYIECYRRTLLNRECEGPRVLFMLATTSPSDRRGRRDQSMLFRLPLPPYPEFLCVQ